MRGETGSGRRGPGEGPATARAQALDTTTPERLARSAHHSVEVRERTRGGMPSSHGVRIHDQTPLDAYARRGMLTERQTEAGRWLARCFRRAVYQPSTTTCYGVRLGRGAGSDPMLDGREALWRVLLAAGLADANGTALPLRIQGRTVVAEGEVRAPIVLNRLGTVALSVCGLEEWAGGTRRLEALRKGLDRLADHVRAGRRPAA